MVDATVQITACCYGRTVNTSGVFSSMWGEGVSQELFFVAHLFSPVSPSEFFPWKDGKASLEVPATTILMSMKKFSVPFPF